MKSTLQLSLPPALKKWVDDSKGRASADQFVLDVLRRQQAAEAVDEVDRQLHLALDSGSSTPMTGKDWERIGKAGRRRFLSRRKK